MKILLRFAFVVVVAYATAISGYAQTSNTLIHYWNFDNVQTATISPSTPTIPNIAADYSAIDKSKALVTYYLLPGTSLTASKRYIDPYTGVDSVNARLNVVPTGSGGNFSLRLRNPLDSMELRIYAPTTGFSNIVFKYALMTSSVTNGDSVNWFDYSVDSGAHWIDGKTSGMVVNGRPNSDTLQTLWPQYMGDTYWGLVTVDLSADKSVNNNPKFVFRIRFRGGDNHTSGNNRIDNLTMEGSGSGGKLPATITVKKPATSGILVAGRQTTIAFDTANSVGTSKTIDYSIDNGATWLSVGASTGNSYNWTIPNTPSTSALVRVKDDEGTVGISAPFVIASIDPKTNHVIQYWDFNTLTAAYSNPNIPPFTADFSAKESAAGSIAYTLVPNASSSYKGYVDNVAGDSASAKFGVPAGQALRVRNPTDSMELRLHIPTTGFKNISLGYAIEESSNISPLTRNFDYSVDGGNTWITTGLSMTTESNLDSTKFDPVNVTFAAGSSAENNANLIFRIRMTGGKNSGTSGNDRYDNIVVMGDPITTNHVTRSDADLANYTLYPNPSANELNITSQTSGIKSIEIVAASGRVVLSTEKMGNHFVLNVSELTNGTYFIHLYDKELDATTTMIFVKQ